MKYLLIMIMFAFTFLSSYAEDSVKLTKSNLRYMGRDDITRHKYKIDIDLDAGTVKVPLRRNKPKKIKVGSFMYVSLKNLPNNYKVHAYITFENGNMESGSLFSKVLGDNVEKIKENANTTQPSEAAQAKNFLDTLGQKAVPSPNEIKDDGEEKNRLAKTLKVSEIKSINGSTKLEDLTEERKFKVDIFDLPNKLRISETKSFLKNYKPTNSDSLAYKKAYLDLIWQEGAILNANENIEMFKGKKDSLIRNYAKRIDSLNGQLSKSNPPKYEKNLIGIQVHNTDYTKARIEIKDETNKLVNVIPLNYNNMGGFKLDFSTGFFNSFYETFNYKINKKDTLINNITTGVDSVVRIDKISNGRNNISFGILAHAHWRITQSFNPALSTGFTYTPANKTLNYLVGLSALCGRQQRFVVTAGISFNRVEQLEYLSTEKDYHISVLNLASNLTYNSKLKGSAFIGVSYNLGSLNGSGSETQVLY